MPKGMLATAEQISEIQRLRADGILITQIASKVGVSKDTVMKYTSPAQETDSGRVRLLRAVCENGPTDVDELTELAPDLDKHNLTHLLYSLSKNGYVTFREVKRDGTGTHLERITATRRGLNYAGLPVKPTSAALGDKRSPSIHPGDGSDFRNQPGVAPGRPVTRSWTTPEPRIERVVPAPDHEVAIPAPVTHKAAIVIIPTYPVIGALFERRTYLEQAAKLLEQAGQDELALAALGKADEFTPLEKEAMALYEEMSKATGR